MNQGLLKKAKLKSIFEKKGFRINTKNLEKISSLIEKETKDYAEKIMRNTRLSGRKTIKIKDIDDITK